MDSDSAIFNTEAEAGDVVRLMILDSVKAYILAGKITGRPCEKPAGISITPAMARLLHAYQRKEHPNAPVTAPCEWEHLLGMRLTCDADEFKLHPPLEQFLAAPRLAWSPTPPTVPGDYKVRYASTPHYAEFRRISQRTIDEALPSFWADQEFAGPYPQPEEPPK